MNTKIVLLLSLLFYASFTLSQEETKSFETKKWTVSSYFFSQTYIYQENDLPNLFTGISVKRYFGSVGVRLSYERMNNSKNYNYFFNDNSTFLGSENHLIENALKIGAEYRTTYYDFITFHLFADYIINSYKGGYNNYDTTFMIAKKADIKGQCQGAIIGMGFDILLSEHFSVGIETRLDVLFMNQQYFIRDYINKTTVEYMDSDFNLQLRLLGNLSLNYHF